MILTEENIQKGLKKLVRMHAYGILIVFVMYIFASLFSGITEFLVDLVNIVNGNITPEGREKISIQILHDLAFTLILYKAFIVFLSYARTLHISVKLILELAIIAPIVELIFNFHGLSYIASMIYTGMAIGMSGVYLFFYQNVRLTEEDHLKIKR